MIAGRVRQPLRMLLLPARHGTEKSCGRSLKKELVALGVLPDDFLNWVSLQLEQWRLLGTPSSELRQIVKSSILAACTGAPSEVIIYGAKLADRYFEIHEKLIREHLMSHEEGVTFLSHAFLIAHLASAEKLSAAQIANLLSQRDQRARFSRQSIASALEALRVQPELSIKQVRILYFRDAGQELAAFADADLPTAAELVTLAGERLGYQGDLLTALKTLSPISGSNGLSSPYTPYLQILHYQCSIAEYFDHAVTDLYEFSPRGASCNWLHSQYPDSITGAGNPFLNNAKSVEVADIGWVRSKKSKERPGAMALLSILQGLQAMGFFARRELARWLRLWLHRAIRIAGSAATAIPTTLSPQQISSLIARISLGNTETFGILEQRVVDAITVCLHPQWRTRGLGDSVNTTNLSRTKLGDCEFLNPATKSLVAYESHGGKLTAVYVEEHLATIKKSVLRRIDELTAIADISAWSAEIIFVAHEVIGEIPDSVTIEGLAITIKTATFSTFLATQIPSDSEAFSSAITEYFLTPLQAQRTPNEVRQKLLSSI
ncbi:MAG: hypothetical protein B0A82_19960 [Alkalinema sp. CACIAM 70d]|nr:MAG: hypothetical protein B0A82_19960 [Alkalinema sp. CACIAM 70d]